MVEAEPEANDSFSLDASMELQGGGGAGVGGGDGVDSNFPSFEDLSFNSDSAKEGNQGFSFGLGDCGDGDGTGGDCDGTGEADFSFLI